MNNEARITGKDEFDIEKIRAEITHMLSEARKHEDEREKLRAETAKIQTETKWHVFYRVALMWGSAFAALAAVITLVKLFL